MQVKHILPLAVFIIVSLLITPRLIAATSATVTATVTAQNVAVGVTDGAVAYGTLAVGGSESTTSTGVNDTQTATNDGNVNEDFNIRGQDSASWTLTNTQASEQYFHKFCTSSCDASPVWTALTTSNQTLANTVSAGSTQDFDLLIGVPSSTSDYDQQDVDVIVQASAS